MLNNASEILFDNDFLALGNDLQTVLISDANANKTVTIHGSDITAPITGTYQVAGKVQFKGKNLRYERDN